MSGLSDKLSKYQGTCVHDPQKQTVVMLAIQMCQTESLKYIRKTHYIQRVHHYPQSQTPTEGLGTYSLWIRGEKRRV